MRLRHIEVFHAIYMSGSITAAARRLGVSQPSISKVLAHAEQQLGYRLFDRIRGKLVPTREADQLIALVSVVYNGVEDIKQLAANLAGFDRNKIRFAMTPACGIRMMPAAIEHYRLAHPNILFEVETLTTQRVIRALNQSRIDLALVFHPTPTPDIEIEPLARSRLVLAAHESLGLGARQRMRIEDLADLPFVGLSLRDPLGQLLQQHVDYLDERFRPQILVESSQVAMALVGEGAGLAIVDEVTARSMAGERVAIIQLEPAIQFEIALMRAAGRPQTAPAAAFEEYLGEQVRQFVLGLETESTWPISGAA